MRLGLECSLPPSVKRGRPPRHVSKTTAGESEDKRQRADERGPAPAASCSAYEPGPAASCSACGDIEGEAEREFDWATDFVDECLSLPSSPPYLASPPASPVDNTALMSPLALGPLSPGSGSLPTVVVVAVVAGLSASWMCPMVFFFSQELVDVLTVLAFAGFSSVVVFVITVCIPREPPAQWGRILAAGLLLSSVSMLHIAYWKYMLAAEENWSDDSKLRAVIAWAPVLAAWYASAATWSSNGATLWSSVRVAFVFTCASRLICTLYMHHFISPTPLWYPPGVSFFASVAINVAMMLIALCYTLTVRLRISSAVLHVLPDLGFSPRCSVIG